VRVAAQGFAHEGLDAQKFRFEFARESEAPGQEKAHARTEKSTRACDRKEKEDDRARDNGKGGTHAPFDPRRQNMLEKRNEESESDVNDKAGDFEDDIKDDGAGRVRDRHAVFVQKGDAQRFSSNLRGGREVTDGISGHAMADDSPKRELAFEGVFVHGHLPPPAKKGKVGKRDRDESKKRKEAEVVQDGEGVFRIVPIKKPNEDGGARGKGDGEGEEFDPG